MGQYLPLLALLILASLFAGLSMVATRLLNPPRPNPSKASPYECGVVDQVAPPERFPVRFYLIAMIFIVFDIEIVFFYPFSMIYRSLGAFGIGAIVLFAFAVFESFLYLIANGALEWAPLARQRRLRSTIMVDQNRTTTSTVRRVGTEGRPHDDRQAGDADHEAA
jgi:NADH-quinone oxidoreductase subunit A